VAVYETATRLFILCRHAESAANASGVIDSDPVGGVALTRRGEAQAHALGVQFAGLQVSLAVASRFRRTTETARLALKGRAVPLVTEAAFDEIAAGALNGASIEDYWSWRENHDESERPPGGESLDEVRRRHATGLRRLLARDEAVTLVVLHEIGLHQIARASAAGSSLEIGAFAPAVPYLFDEGAIGRAAEALEAGAAEPDGVLL